MKKPTTKLPVTLMKSVPKGNMGLMIRAANRLMTQRALAPKIAPIEITSKSLMGRLRKMEFSSTVVVGVISLRWAGGFGELHRREKLLATSF
jgi:hypothetical protein